VAKEESRLGKSFCSGTGGEGEDEYENNWDEACKLMWKRGLPEACRW